MILQELEQWDNLCEPCYWWYSISGLTLYHDIDILHDFVAQLLYCIFPDFWKVRIQNWSCHQKTCLVHSKYTDLRHAISLTSNDTHNLKYLFCHTNNIFLFRLFSKPPPQHVPQPTSFDIFYVKTFTWNMGASRANLFHSLILTDNLHWYRVVYKVHDIMHCG